MFNSTPQTVSGYQNFPGAPGNIAGVAAPFLTLLLWNKIKVM
jgi:hypothetical protein